MHFVGTMGESMSITDADGGNPGRKHTPRRWGLTSPVNLQMDGMGVSENRGTPKSSILIGFSIINHPFWGTPTFLETPV